MKSGKRKWIRGANYVMSLLFIFGAMVQLNDPDPVPWMLIYGAAAGACLWWRFGKAGSRTICLLLTGVALVWALGVYARVGGAPLYLQDIFQSFEMKNREVELFREFGGLLIIAFWMMMLAVFAEDGSG